ncbi:MAG TPA: ATP-grasp domain-containing protein [Thermoplasmatales archaeon]|uniref:Carbamoylphosphate synthase large subunit n=1 Tax=Candidatus Syntropharchaeum caldarium TaxID=1838285 RepID=A0A1F2P9R9_9EURY|nr:MAG: carbamoylphosphate synthase large subunit [Candidatus Syntrophoarchaeum caldarius]HEC77315.1 ATP-grasp domain-containing protein [Thermoplasmatales archaeon]
MDGITVLITGVGAPGIKGTLYSLEKNFDNRKIKTVGTDMKEDAIGKYLCDKFYQIPKPSNNEYLSQLLNICEKESVDVLLPQNTAELPALAEHKKDFGNIGTEITISDRNSIEIANNKYKLMKTANKIDVPTPKFYLADNFNDLLEYANELGWPKKRVVVKPPVSNGMRGLRIIDESMNLKDIFYSKKPTGVYLKMDNLKEILGPSFPRLLVMEYLPNKEYTVDVLNTESLTVIPRKRDLIKYGITFNGTVEKNEEIIEYSERLSEALDLRYAYGFQFKLDENNVPKLLESNPRIQGTMVLATFAGANIIYGAVKYALGEEVPEFDIVWGTRIMRYWGGIRVNEATILGRL